MKVAATTTINNSIDINNIKGVPGIENYNAFISWICGVKFNGRVHKIDDIKQICEVYKLYDYSIKTRKTNTRNNKIKATNCETNETIVFENRKVASDYFGYTCPKVITTYISKNTKAKGKWYLNYC